MFIIWPTKAKRHRYIHKKMIYDQVMGRPGDILYLPGSRRDKKWLNKVAVYSNTRKVNFWRSLVLGRGVWEGVPLDDAVSTKHIIGIITATLEVRSFWHETFSKLRVATSHIHHRFHSNLINISAVIQEGNHLETFVFVMPQSLNCWPWKSKNPSSPRRSAGKIFLSSNWRIDRWTNWYQNSCLN